MGGIRWDDFGRDIQTGALHSAVLSRGVGYVAGSNGDWGLAFDASKCSTVYSGTTDKITTDSICAQFYIKY